MTTHLTPKSCLPAGPVPPSNQRTSVTSMLKGLAAGAFGIATLVATAPASPAIAITISSSQASGQIPATAGTGLSAFFYKFSSGISSLAEGDTKVAAAAAPTATFTALNVCFPSCGNVANDGALLSTYVVTNGTSLAGTSTLGNSVTYYLGYIAIPAAGNYTFTLGGDDGVKLLIAKTEIIAVDGLHPLVSSTATVTFGAAGLYRFFVDHFENGGETGVTVLENGFPLVTSTLYPAGTPLPEPMGVALLGAGLLGLGMVRRRRAVR